MSDTKSATGGTMTILQKGNPLLATVSTDVTEFDAALVELVNTMARTMIASNGIGLSAIQIGVTRRVLVAIDQRVIYVMINPVLTRTGKRMVVEKEGCLSIERSLWRNVGRPAKCEVSFKDLQGNPQSLSLSGNLSRIVQHEIDHLDGILITDKPPVKDGVTTYYLP